MKRSVNAFVAALLVAVAGSAMAASFIVQPDSETGSLGPWNPRAQDGLLATLSGHIDFVHRLSDTGDTNGAVWSYDNVYTQVVGAAAYGSDTSAGADALNPRLRGLAIEPMADVSAFASTQCSYHSVTHSTGKVYTTDSCVIGGGPTIAFGYASAVVNHRIALRGLSVSPEVQALLGDLLTVPVYLDFQMSASATLAGDSFAAASFSVTQLGTRPELLYTDYVCAGDCDSGISGSGQVERAGRWTTTLTRSASGRDVIFEIEASAGGTAWSYSPEFGPGKAEAQAVADPFLAIDPTWAYAPYFMVQQESVLNPGEWVEVTRVWQTAPVPEAPTWLMLVGGMALLGRSARRAR